MSSDEEAEFNDGVEEDEEGTSKPAMNGEDSGYEEMNGGGRKRRSSRGTVSYKEDDGGDDDDDEAEDEDASAGEEEEGDNDDDDDDDDDDDVPLASLKSPSPAKKKKASATTADTKNGSKTKTKTTTKASATKKKKTATATTKSASSSTTDYASPSFALYGSESKKGELIQKLLCRWWYAITWPDASALPDKPPPNYDTLDGFPGVYVCTKGEEVGTIKDMRDKNKAPNFNNFAKMSSKELRDLLIKAVQEQKRQLIAAEGAGTSTEKELNSILNWAEKVNTDKADKDAAKILKASKLSLPE
jgi:hypothetical protein